MTTAGSSAEYEAKSSYDYDQAVRYEKRRFSGLLGRYRWQREQAAVGELIGRIPLGSTILDCPCGMGRWWPLLLARAEQLTAMDISPGMLEFAAKRPEVVSGSVKVMQADAEAIPLADDSVDFVRTRSPSTCRGRFNIRCSRSSAALPGKASFAPFR